MRKRGAPMHSVAHVAGTVPLVALGAQRRSLAWLPALAGHAIAGETRQTGLSELIAIAESSGDAAAVHTSATEV